LSLCLCRVVSSDTFLGACLARTAFTNKDCGKGEREAQWAVEQRTLHGLNQLATSSDLPPSSAKVARYVSLATVFDLRR
jgi:hypothetical protein